MKQMGNLGDDVMPILQVHNVKVLCHHQALVLEDVSLSVPAHSIVALLGGVGSGKTTLIKAISGLLYAEQRAVIGGSIILNGHTVQGMSVDALIRRGCIQIMEQYGCFERLTVEENLIIGTHLRDDGNVVIRKSLAMVYDYFPFLYELRLKRAGSISRLERQMVLLGRALMSKPVLILLDEPSFGLDLKAITKFFTLVQKLNEHENIAFLLAEQNVHLALQYAVYAYVMDTGRVIFGGRADQLRNDENIKHSYLGIAGGHWRERHAMDSIYYPRF